MPGLVLLGEWDWRIMSSVSDPGAGRVGVVDVTVLLGATDRHGGDAYASLAELDEGWELLLQERTSGEQMAHLRLTVKPTDLGTWFAMPHDVLSTGGGWAPAGNDDIMVWRAAPDVPGSSPSGVTVDDVAGWLAMTVRSSEVDSLLQRCLDATVSHIAGRLGGWVPVPWPSHVETAVLIQTSRLYKRRNSPEGVAGFGEFGVVRVSSLDPDVETLLGRDLLYAVGGAPPLAVEPATVANRRRPLL